MKRGGYFPIIVVLFLTLFPQSGSGEAGEKTLHENIFVEIFLSPEHRKDAGGVQETFNKLGIKRVRIQFHRLGISPKNIAIGKDIPASVARIALRMAIDYNDGINALLPEYRFFPTQIAIGSSAFDEKSEVPLSQEALQKLLDPGLTNETFHFLYRHLTEKDVRFLK